MKFTLIILAALLAAGCAEQSAMRLSANTVRVNVSTAPIYGAVEPERRAMVIAAEETLKHGYDRFLIVSGQSELRRNTIGVIPAQTNGSWSANAYGGSGYVSHTGARPIGMPRFETQIMVKMFHRGESGADQAIDAHQVLAESGNNR